MSNKKSDYVATSSKAKAEVTDDRLYDAWKKARTDKPSIGDKNTSKK